MNRTALLGSLILAAAILLHAVLSPHPRYQLVSHQYHLARLDVRTGEIAACLIEEQRGGLKAVCSSKP